MENIMEIERKYLVSEVPANLKDYHCRVIEQGYLSTHPVVRVRKDNDSYSDLQRQWDDDTRRIQPAADSGVL